MNLEEIGLVQLSTTEVQETEGGFFLLLQNPIVIAFALGVWNQYQSHSHP